MRPLARSAAAKLAATPLAPLLRTAPARSLRRRVAVAFTLDEADRIFRALSSAGVNAWLVGGWGVDALIGTQSRLHLDVDVAVDLEEMTSAIAALRTIGYEPRDDGVTAGVWLPFRTRLEDDRGRSIEVLSVGKRAQRGFSDDWVVDGSIDGRSFRCASARLQLRFHQGYRPTSEDRRDVAALTAIAGVPAPAGYTPATRQPGLVTTGVRRTWRRARGRVGDRPPDSALVVPVEAVARRLGDVRGYTDPSLDAGVPAHVTLLYPFVPPHRIDAGCEQAISQALSTLEPFDFALSRVGSFPGVVFLAPDPAWRFVQFTQALWARWPEHPPYRGDFDSVVPHLTIGNADDGLDLTEVERALPIRARAEEAILLVEGPGPWAVRARFALGG